MEEVTTTGRPGLSRRRALQVGAAAGAAASAALAAQVAGAGPASAATTAFGVTTATGTYTVSSGAGLVFVVSRTNGDITSMTYNGTELLSSRASHVQSGLGSSTTTVQVSVTTSTVVITEYASDFYGGEIYHYIVVRKDENTLYMATWIGTDAAGELRWYSSFSGSVFTGYHTPSYTNGGTAIESADVFTVGTETRSKYYSNRQARNLTVRGITGSGVGAFMYYGTRESSSGGPFFRDIEQQYTGNNDLYNYMHSGHNQTEDQRLGVLHGPYALMITGGSTPSAPDVSFMADLGLKDHVPDEDRGYVQGKVVGVTYADAYVGWHNDTAQYWVAPSSTTGNFSSPMMKPGTYTQTLYQGELAVATRSVTVTAGAATTGQNITSAWTTPTSPVFTIGTWDGTPGEFRNASSMTYLHPSDARLSSWTPGTFTVGTSTASSWPCYQWKDVNGTLTIVFTLAAADVVARTVRIGITAAFAGARPRLGVNSWTSAIPTASTQPDSRSLTIGTYRGNNVLFTYAVPASAFVTGSNTISVYAVSGSSGTTYLSPGYSFDCIDMY